MGLKIRLVVMNFLQYAVWGAYLTSMGTYLAGVGLAGNIGIFYAMQGIVSLFMPALIGIIADRWVPAQKMLGICHLLAAGFMVAAGYYGMTTEVPEFGVLFSLYAFGVAFYMPTIALSNSVAYSVLGQAGLDTVKHFPPIRVWGTVGFIGAMLVTNFLHFGGASMQTLPQQFVFSAILGVVLGLYSFSLPRIAVNRSAEKRSFVEASGLKAFTLFKQKKMALFFIFSMLLGVSLQITNGFANPFIDTFKTIPEFANSWGANNANALISLSQISEAMCILLIPFFLRRFGIKNVMLIAMFAWVLRFGFFGAGNPGGGVWMFVMSMLVYGVAFDFFNVSGSLFVDKETDPAIRSSAQGLFMMMTNGIGATIGTLGAQAVVDRFVYSQQTTSAILAGWSTAWYLFAAYALVVAVMFWIVFKYKHTPTKA
ncbi:MAG: MFS transporter [Rikenellaceae bacterium]|jgi:nucleoside transporter|nr:MFS transporter [Rikenellaceae bacterium]